MLQAEELESRQLPLTRVIILEAPQEVKEPSPVQNCLLDCSHDS